MASIKPRGKSWRAEVCVGGVRRSKTFESKEESKRWARRLEAAADDGLLIARPGDNNCTLAELIERFIEERVIGWRRTPTAEHREIARLRGLARTDVAQKMISRLCPEDFADHRTRRMRVAKPSTICKELNTFSLVLKTAMTEWGYRLLANPCDSNVVRRPRFDNQRDRILMPEETERLWAELARCENSYVLPAAQFAAETALRRAELLGLKWMDLNLTARTMCVRRVLDQISGELQPFTKNSGVRHVPLTSKAIEILQSLPRQGERIFATTHEVIDGAFVRALKRAEIHDFRWHDLRHCAVTALATHIPIPMDLMSITGHKTLQQVVRYYTARQAAELATRLP